PASTKSRHRSSTRARPRAVAPNASPRFDPISVARIGARASLRSPRDTEVSNLRMHHLAITLRGSTCLAWKLKRGPGFLPGIGGDGLLPVRPFLAWKLKRGPSFLPGIAGDGLYRLFDPVKSSYSGANRAVAARERSPASEELVDEA